MASGSQNMTTYYAKRIVGDASAAQANSALLQTGAGVTVDTWILNRTNRATTYGIKYVYDDTDGHDKVEFYGGAAAASAWVQLDTGNITAPKFIGALEGNADTATKLSNTPNNTTTFLRGDNIWSNTLTGTLLLPAGLKTGSRVNGSGAGIEIGDDGGIEIYHSTTPFIDFHYQASTADYSIRLICNSATELKCSTSFTAAGYIYANDGYLKSTANGNTVTIGSQNTGWCHISNSADRPFWFSNTIQMEKGKVIGGADTQYRPFQLYLGRYTTTASNDLDANNPLIEFSNSDRSQYCQLMYDDHDSLCTPDSLTLVGNQNGITFICKNGPIWVQGGSNAGGNINRLTTSSGMPGNMQYNTSRRGTQIYSNGIAFADPYNGNSNNDAGWIRHQETTANTGELEIAVGDDGDETIVVRQYNTSNGVKRTLTLLSKDGYTFIPSYLNIGGHEKNASSPTYVWGSNSSDNYLRSYQTSHLSVATAVNATTSSSCTGNAATATRINGNLAAATSNVNRNIWVSSGAGADGIPNYISGFNMNPSTKVFTVPAGTRISPSAGDLYLGNSGNQKWVYIQDMCGQDGQKWKIHQNGNAEFTGTVTATKFSGPLTGDVTGNCSGSSGSCTGNAATSSGVLDIGNTSKTTTFAYSKAGLAYADYTWLAGWNGYELRAVNKSQFAQASHNHAAGDINSGTLAVARGGTGQTSVANIQAGKDGSGNTITSYYCTLSTAQTFTGNKTFNSICYFANGTTYYVNKSGDAVFKSAKGAVWNDYAEYRKTVDNVKPGQVVIDNDDGSLSISTERLQSGAHVVSDTYGFSMGETEETKTPVAVSGRVLVYTYRLREVYHAGMAVCSAPNGTVDIMTRNEIMMYPECIVGIVSEIPNYEVWHGGSQDGKDNIEVNDRIWIYVR